jgi:DNA polymerase-3 subunit gamma/tau
LILRRLREISESEGIEISTGALEQVVFSGGGSMRDAMSALDQVIAFCGSQVRDEDVTALLGLVEPKVLSRATHAVAEDDLPTLLGIVEDLVESGQDLFGFCRRFSGHLRNLMVLKAGISDPALLGIPESLLPDLRDQAGLFSREDLLRLFDAFQRIESGVKYATQTRFHLEMGLIELAHIRKLRPLEELIGEFAAIAEGQTPPRSGPAPKSPASASTPKPARRPPAGMNPGRKAAPGDMPKRKERTPATSPEAPSAGNSETASTVRDPREFLLRIAAAVGKESLESLLQSLDGARLQGDRLILEPGTAGDFVCRQIRDGIPVIAQAAEKVTGSKVTVVLEETGSRQAEKPESKSNPAPEHDLLEKAKREPVIKSFLDVFPGPVKAEKIDS